MRLKRLLRAALISTLILGWAGLVGAVDMSGLIDKDCTKCHSKVIIPFQQLGGAHAVDLGCTDCHLDHPREPGAPIEITACADCHNSADNKHYTLENCTACHHAHKPLELDFTQFEAPVEKICATCHENPYQESSAHAENLACNECHLDHSSKSSCLDCHEGHSRGKSTEPCINCHAPHNPAPALAAGKLDAVNCSACHTETGQLFTAHEGAHTELACDECHAVHGRSPVCLDCHEGHNPQMATTGCKTCHDHHLPSPVVFTRATDPADCADCHNEESQLFSTKGAAHQENLSCLECHPQHPPAENALPACADCHDPAASTHYALPNCSRCHDPHAPKTGDLSQLEQVGPACATCHEEVLKSQQQQPTAHSKDLDCNQCHTQHGRSPSCLDCHEGHDKQMQNSDCAQCHKHHTPLPVSYGSQVKPTYCNGCHEDTVNQFSNHGGEHQAQLSCLDCHRNHPPAEGPMISCSDCHAPADNPHFAVDACLDCHNPHQPLQNDLSGMANSRPLCAGCHEQVEKELVAHAGGHDQDCIDCHNSHVTVPSCLECHEGHGPDMQGKDCLACHPAHNPDQIQLQSQPQANLCGPCHKPQTAAITKAGGAHRDAISCTSCHDRHPDASCTRCHSVHPQQGDAIPDNCFGCHAPDQHPHYTVGNCRECHDPHQPENLQLKNFSPQAPVCLSCHSQIGEELTAHPGGHSQQDCAACHSNHTTIRLCLDCHQPHVKSMTSADCLRCHPAHQPQNIRYQQAEKIPKQFCAACHQTEAEGLATAGDGHRDSLDGSCTICHPEHKPQGKATVVACNDCHPRAKRRHYVLGDCAGCHDPHQPHKLDLGQEQELKPVCISCHNNQLRLIQQYPNKHTEMDCGKCHPGEHGSTRECLECHKAHIPKQTNRECLRCHPAHLPHKIKDKPGQVQAVCVSCHQDPATKLSKHGGKHKKQSCIACHHSHPPHGKEVMPDCTMCHDEDKNLHYQAGNCDACHQGHQPLGHDLSKAANSAPACLACHEDVGETFTATPSAHARQNCIACHPQHGEAQKCTACHQGHYDGQTDEQCLSCHTLAHAPNQVAVNAEESAATCVACHKDQVTALATGHNGHSKLNCGACHAGTHGAALTCAACHELPHDPGLHRKYPDCLTCHIDPHALAEWRVEDTASTPDSRTEEPAANPAAESETTK